MSEPTRWGVIATGKISSALAWAIGQVADARLWSVVSRDPDRAAAFAAEFGAERHHGDLDAFLADPELEVVAVGTPHPMHCENTLRCVEAGKHVLCEKPMALNLVQVERMISAAQEHGRFLMEAMWMWFIPAVVEARRLVVEGAIGEPRFLAADFGFNIPFDPQARHFSLELGGGALLDIGIYPLALALYFFGPPDEISGQAVLGTTGVDEQLTAGLRWSDGRMASCAATIRASSTCEAMVAGSDGHLRLHRRFWHTQRLSLVRLDGSEETIHVPHPGNGYEHEIAEVQRCLQEGRLESPVMSWDASRQLVTMMDTLRARWGVRYPGE